VSFLLAWGKTRQMKWPLRKSLIGFALFVAGAGLLLVTNQWRFGSGLEFGHSLNLNGYEPMLFMTHIQNPLAHESLPGLVRELFCFLFVTLGVPLSNQGFDPGLFPGQIPAIRWRDLYYSNYDETFLIGILATGAWMVWMLWQWKRNRKIPFDNELWVAGAWCMLSIIPTFVFYLRYPVLSPRYMLDFGPAFAVAAWVFVCGLRRHLPNKWKPGIIICSLVASWWGYEVASAQILPVTGNPGTITVNRVSNVMTRNQAKTKPLPDSYAVGADLGYYGIPFNGTGWNSTNGATKCAAVFFVQDPQCLQMDIAPAPGARVDESDWKQIRAKIGREFLTLESTRAIQDGRTMLFRLPRGWDERSGIQVIFLGFTRPEELHTSDAKVRLLRISWKKGAR